MNAGGAGTKFLGAPQTGGSLATGVRLTSSGQACVFAKPQETRMSVALTRLNTTPSAGDQRQPQEPGISRAMKCLRSDAMRHVAMALGTVVIVGSIAALGVTLSRLDCETYLECGGKLAGAAASVIGTGLGAGLVYMGLEDDWGRSDQASAPPDPTQQV